MGGPKFAQDNDKYKSDACELVKWVYRAVRDFKVVLLKLFFDRLTEF